MAVQQDGNIGIRRGAANDSTLVLEMDSPDGDNNFPGNVKATVCYTLTPMTMHLT